MVHLKAELLSLYRLLTIPLSVSVWPQSAMQIVTGSADPWAPFRRYVEVYVNKYLLTWASSQLVTLLRLIKLCRMVPARDQRGTPLTQNIIYTDNSNSTNNTTDILGQQLQ